MSEPGLARHSSNIGSSTTDSGAGEEGAADVHLVCLFEGGVVVRQEQLHEHDEMVKHTLTSIPIRGRIRPLINCKLLFCVAIIWVTSIYVLYLKSRYIPDYEQPELHFNHVNVTRPHTNNAHQV